MQSKLKYLGILLPALLPLLVFVAADELTNTTNALILAIGSGIAVFIFTWVRNKKPDKFVLVDTLLLAAFGGISIILHDEIFFKLKPGIIQTILVAVIGVSAYSPKNLMLNMARRYMPGQEFNDVQVRQMRQQTRVLFWIFLGHTLLVYYSAFYMSKEAWAFISGGLFYIVAGGWLLVEFIRQKIKMSNIEWLPVLNEKGNVIGKATRDQVHSGSKVLHPVVHLHIFNPDGKLYVQKRQKNKKIQPGKWDTAVGGHVSFKETPQKSLYREAREEIGLTISEPQFLFSYIWESDVEREMVYVFAYKTSAEPVPNPKELLDGKYLSIQEVKKNLGKSFFTPNFEKEFQMLMKHIRTK